MIIQITGNRIPITLIILLSLLFVSCNKEKQEEKRFKELTSSIKYNVYKELSLRTVSVSVAALNKSKDSSFAEPDFVRIMLGFTWLTMKRYDFAVAEGMNVIEKGNDKFYRAYAHLLNAGVMYENGWRLIGAREEAKGMACLKECGERKQNKSDYLLHLISAYRYVNRTDFENARNELDYFGKSTGISWPVALADIALDVKNLNISGATAKLGNFMNDSNVPDKAKAYAGSISEKIKSGGDIAKSISVIPADVFSIILDQHNSNVSSNPVLRLINDIKEKLK